MSPINNYPTQKFYTDGIVTIRLKPGEEIPEGFHLGRTFNSNPWNKNLTAETDDRIKEYGAKVKNTRQANGTYDNPWNKGLTKETDERVAKISSGVKNAREDKFWTTNAGVPRTDAQKQKQSQAMQGRDPWNKGQSKETNASIAAGAEKLKGHKSFVTDWEKAKEKEYITKKLNGTFNTSKPEEDLRLKLQAEYGAEDVIAQYRDPRYKNKNNGNLYNCDFYIKSLDLFIELNLTWFHGKHPFDETNPSDIEQLYAWQLKADQSSYAYAIKVWTELDPQKLAEFRNNNLNFLIIYPNNLIINK